MRPGTFNFVTKSHVCGWNMECARNKANTRVGLPRWPKFDARVLGKRVPFATAFNAGQENLAKCAVHDKSTEKAKDY